MSQDTQWRVKRDEKLAILMAAVLKKWEAVVTPTSTCSHVARLAESLSFPAFPDTSCMVLHGLHGLHGMSPFDAIS